MFRLPTHNYYPGEIDSGPAGDAKKRRLIFAMSLFTGANDSMKRGWFVKPGLGMIKDVMPVTYFVDERFEIKIVRDKQVLEPAPGAVIQAPGAGVGPIKPVQQPAEIQVTQTTPAPVKDEQENGGEE
jgi:hypothetical protein